MNRTEAQEKALFTIYDVMLLSKAGMEVDVEEIISGICAVPYEKADPFVKRMTIEAIKHMPHSIPLYQKHMPRWRFDRLNILEQALLLLSYSQFFHGDEITDKKVVINVAVDFAKKYLDAKDYKFVNAILDKVLVKDD